MKVKIFDYGSDEKNYYVVYKVTGLNPDEEERLQGNVEGNVEIREENVSSPHILKKNIILLEVKHAQCRIEDFIAREEIEMTVYLTSVLEDE